MNTRDRVIVENNEKLRRHYDMLGAEAFATLLDREYALEHASDETDRSFWAASVEYWRERAMYWWQCAAECGQS